MCDPATRIEVVNEACPLAFRAPFPSLPVPSKNVTGPVGVGVLLVVPVAVAANTTDCSPVCRCNRSDLEDGV